MNLNLQEKVYIVSGSSQGIGKAIALGLLDEGAFVVITGRDSKKLENCQNFDRSNFSLDFNGQPITYKCRNISHKRLLPKARLSYIKEQAD